MRTVNITLVSLLYVSLTVVHAVAAGSGGAPQPLPTIPEISTTGYDMKICPICRKSRQVCNETYLKAQELRKANRPLPQGMKVCAVHTTLGKIKTVPVFCPICKYKVDVPLVPMKTNDTDTDLCPHPVGQVRFLTSIVICPNCGFAATRKQFRSRDPRYFTPALKQWVRENLTPQVRKAEWQLLTGKLKGIRRDEMNTVLIPTGRKRADGSREMSRVALASLFDQQETLPDTIRTRHAYAYYTALKADPAKRAYLAWQAAWAHRREVSGPLNGVHVMPSVKRILQALEHDKVELLDLSGKINHMAKLYRDKERFSYLERQITRILLAGYYARQGHTSWANQCLQQVIQNAHVLKNGTPRAWPKGQLNPWLQGRPASATILSETRATRQTLATIAAIRQEMLAQESKYLSLAARLVRQALKQNRYAPAQIPAYIYLVGEFERRREAFGAARVWLRAAQGLLGEDIAIEHYAPSQLMLLNAYSKHVKSRYAYSAQVRKNDLVLLTTLKLQIERAGTLKPGLRAMKSPARTSSPKEKQTAPRKR